MHALINSVSGVDRHLQVAHPPGPRKRPGRRFERLINKAPGSAGGYLL